MPVLLLSWIMRAIVGRTETSRTGLEANVESGARVFWSYGIHEIGEGFTIDEQFTDLDKLLKDVASEDISHNCWTGV